MASYLTSRDGQIIGTFRHGVEPLWSLKGTSQDGWIAQCRAVGGTLNQTVDPAKLAASASQIPDADVAELVLDERTTVSALLIACNKGDLATTQASIDNGIAIDQALLTKIGAP